VNLQYSAAEGTDDEAFGFPGYGDVFDEEDGDEHEGDFGYDVYGANDAPADDLF
jgi:hypothetical protein